jgi:hypothetical protein
MKDLVLLVDAVNENGASRGGVESALMGMIEVCEDDDGGLWLWKDELS